MPRSTRPLRLNRVYEMSDAIVRKKWFYESYRGGEQPLWFAQTSQLPVMPTDAVAQGSTLHGLSPYGNYMQLFTTTAQSLLPTGSAGNGLEFGCDEVNNEAVEIVPGGNSSSSRLACTVGTTPNFYFKAKIKLTDASGSDQFGIGWRKQEAFAVPTSILTTGDGIYTDFYILGFAGTSANPNPIRVAHDLNNGGSTTVEASGLTWADGVLHELELRVVGSKVLPFVNGVSLRGGGTFAKDGDGAAISAQTITPVPAFTFDTGDVLVPFLYMRHDADVANESYLVEWEAGQLLEVGKDPNAE